MTDTAIILVLKTGGPVYNHRYVNATARNIRESLSREHEIICITDDHSGITEVDKIIRMKHGFPKWWGKVEMFRPGVCNSKNRVFFDLDTVCIGNIDFIVEPREGFYGLRDFYQPAVFQTGLLKWQQDAEAELIYSNFLKEDFSKYKDRGDHEWIGSHVRNKKYIQDEFPDKVVSYKKSIAGLARKMISPSIVCFHGDPRPHTVRYDFITSYWKYT